VIGVDSQRVEHVAPRDACACVSALLIAVDPTRFDLAVDRLAAELGDHPARVTVVALPRPETWLVRWSCLAGVDPRELHRMRMGTALECGREILARLPASMDATYRVLPGCKELTAAVADGDEDLVVVAGRPCSARARRAVEHAARRRGVPLVVVA
jgi:hypothetical protein